VISFVGGRSRPREVLLDFRGGAGSPCSKESCTARALVGGEGRLLRLRPRWREQKWPPCRAWSEDAQMSRVRCPTGNGSSTFAAPTSPALTVAGAAAPTPPARSELCCCAEGRGGLPDRVAASCPPYTGALRSSARRCLLSTSEHCTVARPRRFPPLSGLEYFSGKGISCATLLRRTHGWRGRPSQLRPFRYPPRPGPSPSMRAGGLDPGRSRARTGNEVKLQVPGFGLRRHTGPGRGAG